MNFNSSFNFLMSILITYFYRKKTRISPEVLFFFPNQLDLMVTSHRLRIYQYLIIRNFLLPSIKTVPPSMLRRKMYRISLDPLCFTNLIKANIPKLKTPNNAVFISKNFTKALFINKELPSSYT
jgi:hypothetical protein